MNPPKTDLPTARSGQHPGAAESRSSIETFPERTKPPGKAGLANEARPSLGTRADKDRQPKPAADTPNTPKSSPPHPPEPPHEPSEQNANSLAQELQRDTGVSGHSGGT